MEGVTYLPCGFCGLEDHGELECPRRPTEEDRNNMIEYLVGRYSSPVNFALAIPTASDWMPDRAASLSRLKDQLGVLPTEYREFRDRESNRVWPYKLWRWGLSTGASHILQIQDDVVVSPNFWSALRAMVEAQPDKVIGLHSNHPLSVAQFRAGRRWYRDHWVTGPAYVFPRLLLAQFVDWCEANPDKAASTNEDSLISHWCTTHKIDVWHPVPTITDHDVGVPSTYGNDSHHEYSMYRQPPVTWRDATSLSAMEDPDYWRCTPESAPLLPGPGTQLCWFCLRGQGVITSQDSGARLCKVCLLRAMGGILGVNLSG